MQNPLAQQIPIESLQVADVENNAVPLWNRPLVEEFGLNLLKELVGLETGLLETCQQIVPHFCRVGCYKYCRLIWIHRGTPVAAP